MSNEKKFTKEDLDSAICMALRCAELEKRVGQEVDRLIGEKRRLESLISLLSHQYADVCDEIARIEDERLNLFEQGVTRRVEVASVHEV